MTTLAATARPAVKPGCRLSPPSNPESLLLIPEGALRLHGPGRAILELCDGQRTLADLIDTLCTQFPGADRTRIEPEVHAFLLAMQEKAAVEFL